MEVIEVTEREIEVIEVIERGPQGPAGAAGTGLETLTTQGDTLYRGPTTGERLPIGTAGQILKVNSTATAPEWGAAPATGVTSVSATAPIASSGGNTPAISISEATTSAAGSMSAADKSKLDGIASGAEVNVNADWNASSGDAQILNKPTIPSASSSTPSDLGTAAAGSSADFARADHVHSAEVSDSAFRVIGSTDTTKKVAIEVDANVPTASVVTLTAPASSGTLALTTTAPATHAASHAAAGSDPVTLSGSQVIAPSGGIGIWGDGESVTDVFGAMGNSVYQNVEYFAAASHTHGNITNGGLVGTTSGLPLKTGTGGIVEAGAFGTSAGQFAEGNHTHTQLHDRSHAITSTSDHTAGNHKVFYSNGSGEIVELALGSSGTVLTSNGATSAPSFAAASGGISAIGASAADILSVSGSDLVADDPNADRIVFWDDSAGALKYLTAGSGLTITDTTITASGGVGGGSGSVDKAVIRASGTGGSNVQSSAFLIADNATASPNNTVNHASIQATGDTTNVSVSIVPKGTGAFMLRVPDAASTGGNARGANAVDLQTSRSAATQVASGQESVVCGGVNNTASATQSVVCGGSGNTASGFQSAVFGGRSNTANNDRCFAFGDGNTASSTNAVAFGVGNTASTAQALAIGSNSRADRNSFLAHAAGAFASAGDAQRVRAVLRNKTTTNSAVELFLDGSSVRLTAPSGKVIAMILNITGVKSDGSAVAHYVRQYAIKNVGGTTSEIYAPVTIGTDNAASTSIALSANDTNDALKIEVTGIASETWRWVASVDAVEVAYGT